MEKITLKTVRLIAVDDGAKEIVERLKGDEIYHIESGWGILLDVVITTSGKRIDMSSIPQQGKIVARKTVLLQANGAYEAMEHDGFDAILCFSDYNNVYEKIKSFLYIVYNSLEVHWLFSFDFYDFFSLVKVQNIISLQTYPYTSIGQALSLLEYDSNKGKNKYLLTLCMGDEKDKYIFLHEFDSCKLMERISDEIVLNFNAIPSALK